MLESSKIDESKATKPSSAPDRKFKMRSILIADANQQQRERLAAQLRKDIGCVVFEAEGPVEALQMLEGEEICLLISDLFLPKRGGFDLLRQTHRLSPETAVIIGIPPGEREIGVEAMRLGAFCHLPLPFDFNEAVISAARGLQYHELLVHKANRGAKFRKSEGYHGIIGSSSPMRRLFDIMDKIAEDSSSTVLIQGETGTGKELIARAIHARGPRHGKNFVPVNCAAIPDDLLESELFGYIKGAFTGAVTSKMGRIQYADGGTLFLDEIGDMKPTLQAKLLRVLQEKEFEPLGGVKPVPVDVRVIAATHHDLEKSVAAGTFREDLFYRLSVLPLHVPPLRERREDISLLAEKFIRAFNRQRRNVFLGFDPGSMEALITYSWPGNVRELENLVQRMTILYGGQSASPKDLPEKYTAHLLRGGGEIPANGGGEAPSSVLPEMRLLQQGGRVDFNALVEEFEDRLILQALETTGGNKKEAAKLLGLNRTTLIEKIKKKQLDTSSLQGRYPI